MEVKQLIKDNPLLDSNDMDTFTEWSNGCVDRRLFDLWYGKGKDNIFSFDTPPVELLKNKLKGETVILVASGPSLKKELISGTLQKAAKKYPILVVNRSHIELCKYGITPRYTFIMDSISQPIENGRNDLICCIKSNPKFLKKWIGKKYFFIAGVDEQDQGMPKIFNGYVHLRSKYGPEAIKNMYVFSVNRNSRDMWLESDDKMLKLHYDKPENTNGSKVREEKNVPHFDICYLTLKDGRASMLTSPNAVEITLPMIPMGGNVASGALTIITQILNPKRIVFVGHDYCTYDENEHGRAHTDQRKQWEFKNKNIRGVDQVTNINYFKAAMWTQTFCQKVKKNPAYKDMEFVYTSINGIMGSCIGKENEPAIKYQTLRDFLKEN